MVLTGNPAERLYSILEDALKIGANSQNKPCQEIFSTILEIKISNRNEMVGVVGRLFVLLSSTQLIMNEIEDTNPSVYVDHLSNIRSAIQLIDYGKNWSTVVNAGLNHQVLAGLKLCSFALSLHGAKDAKIDKGELIELQTQIEKLWEKIFNLEIDERLKKYLLISLQKILETIKYFRIEGTSGLEEVIKQSIGNVAFYRAEAQTAQNQEEAEIFDEFSGLIKDWAFDKAIDISKFAK